MRERTILMGGFSKAYAMTGWRVGWMCAPAPILEGIVKVHQYGIMSAPTVAQDAALAAIQGGEPAVRAMVAEYDRRRRLLVDGLNRIGLPTFEPRGAFYAFPQISSTGLSSDEFTERLLREEQVAVVPGNAFGPSGEGHVRMCYATAYEKIEEALVRIERFVDRVRAERDLTGRSRGRLRPHATISDRFGNRTPSTPAVGCRRGRPAAPRRQGDGPRAGCAGRAGDREAFARLAAGTITRLDAVARSDHQGSRAGEGRRPGDACASLARPAGAP